MFCKFEKKNYPTLGIPYLKFLSSSDPASLILRSAVTSYPPCWCTKVVIPKSHEGFSPTLMAEIFARRKFPVGLIFANIFQNSVLRED